MATTCCKPTKPRRACAYGFRLDGHEQVRPDPASRFQPEGPAGLSQIVDPASFHWTDESWRGIAPLGQVIYEMHIGTFTPQGTFAAAVRELPELKSIGITTVEVMPVADFHGQFGWGYDGVSMFAPTRLYGQPDDFRRFVDQAHAIGLGVILDVVYNHFGNVDNYLGEYSDDFRSQKYKNEWADAINYDGENSVPVREFFETNARYWIEEFHLDGFRYDAIHTIHDASKMHILAATNQAARKAAAPRTILLVAEDEQEHVRDVRSGDQGGLGFDALWDDDFHHTAQVRLTGINPGYFSDFDGSLAELAKTIKEGLKFQGQESKWAKKTRGAPTQGVPATAFISFLQNHDQVSNSPTGERIHQLTSPGKYRAMTALWLLMPHTPMFFQGQEFAASSPFLFFADYSGNMAEAVARGRAEFLSQFPAAATPGGKKRLARPSDPETFRRCKLDLSERQKHQPLYELHIDLLKLRREDPVFKQQRIDRLDTAVLTDNCLAVRFFGDDGHDRLLLMNLGGELRLEPLLHPLLPPPSETKWELLCSSDAQRYGGSGAAPTIAEEEWFVPGETSAVWKTS